MHRSKGRRYSIYLKSDHFNGGGSVTPAKRLAALPDVPALGEFVPGYEAFGWYGLGAPRKTPTEVVNKLSDATKAALGDPKSQASFVELGIESMPFSPDEFAKFIAKRDR